MKRSGLGIGLDWVTWYTVHLFSFITFDFFKLLSGRVVSDFGSNDRCA